MTSVRAAAALGVAGAVTALALAGCAVDQQSPAPAPPTSPAPASTSAEDVPEPSTTNTLAPPPRPTGPAPSTAGVLSSASLPVPTGWRRVAPPGNDEIGQAGNGTWVQALDPRYAAQGAVSVGCAEVTRDDYPDPVAALEGGYARTDDPGVGLALEFSTTSEASAFFDVYAAGVRACQGSTDQILVTGLREPAAGGGRGLVDRRTDETQDPTDWTEVALLRGTRLVLVTLGDPGHQITDASADALLAQIPG